VFGVKDTYLEEAQNTVKCIQKAGGYVLFVAMLHQLEPCTGQCLQNTSIATAFSYDSTEYILEHQAIFFQQAEEIYGSIDIVVSLHLRTRRKC
jgi:hypothetical protein